MDLISKIGGEIETGSGMFAPAIFGSAFEDLVQMLQLDNSIYREPIDFSGGRTRNRYRKKRRTVKGGNKYTNGAILIICVVTIISFCTEARQADKILLLFQTERDRVMAEIIMPFITYLRERNPVKGSAGEAIVATIASSVLIPTLNGLYGKLVTMLTGDIVVSGQLISLCTNVDKYFGGEKKEDKPKEKENLKRLGMDVITAMTTPEPTRGTGFTYNVPPGSKIVTPSRLEL